MNKQSLTYKTIIGVIWAVFQRAGGLIITFIANIFLARILSPSDFGCIGLLLTVTSMADVLIDGGLGTAIIQKKNIDQKDISTVFTTNLFISVLSFFLIFFLSPTISKFFGLPILESILKVESISIILRALYLVHLSLMNRNLMFKKIAITTVIANITSAVFSIIFAYLGCGVWSLVIKNVLLHLMLCVLYWKIGAWKIHFYFNYVSFKQLFNFGGLIALSSFIEMFFSNIQSIIIGKKFKTEELGYYTQAKSLGHIPIYSISMMLNQVLFPTLSKLQDNDDGIAKGMRKSLIAITYLAFPIIMLVCILAEPLISLFYSDKWLPATPYLQLVCISGMTNVIIHSNYSLIKSRGKSRSYLFIITIVNILIFTFTILGIKYGVLGMLVCHTLGCYIATAIVMSVAGKDIKYGFFKQTKDIIKPFVVSVIIGGGVYFLLQNIKLNNIFTILIGGGIFVCLYIALSMFFKLEGFDIYKQIFFRKK